MNNFYKVKTQDVPDSYQMEVIYVTGHKEKIEVVSHSVVQNTDILSIRTKADIVRWITLSNIRDVIFDLDFSKILEAKSEKEAEARRDFLASAPEEVKSMAEKQVAEELLSRQLEACKNHLRSSNEKHFRLPE